MTSLISTTSEPSRLHVVHLIEGLGPGGAERLLHTNLEHLDPQYVRSTVCTVFPHATHWVEPIRQLGIPVFSLNCQSTKSLPGGIARFRSWLRGNKPDLVHSHLWAANIVGRIAGRLSGVPVVSSVHNPDHEPEAWSDGAQVSISKRRAVRAIDRWTAHFGCERMIAVSKYVQHSAHRNLRYPLDRMELLYNPIDTNLMETAQVKSRHELLRECGLPETSLVLLNVGRVSPQKGLLHAIRAMPAVLEQYPNAQLVSIGATTDPKWTEQMKEEASLVGASSHVHILGPRRDVADFLRVCDVFVFPSLYEGLGIALIEGMAAGCACVATTAGPIPEVVSHGRDGLLVPPADPASLAEAICSLLADPARRAVLGSAAKESAMRFEPQAAADQLARIYLSVVRDFKANQATS